jgi:hypothetical protein
MTEKKTGIFQRGLIRTAPGTAVRKFTVNDDGGHGSDAKALGPVRYGPVVHVQDVNLAGFTGNSLDHVDRLLTHGTPGTEDFYVAFCTHHFSSFLFVFRGPPGCDLLFNIKVCTVVPSQGLFISFRINLTAKSKKTRFSPDAFFLAHKAGSEYSFNRQALILAMVPGGSIAEMR